MMKEEHDIKVWNIEGTLDRADLEYLSGCTAKVIAPEYETFEIDDGMGRRVRVAGRHNPYWSIMTQTAEQESAVLLKYSERVQLRHVVHMSSASFPC